MESIELADQIVEIIFSKKGFDVKLLDLKNLTTIADYFLICSASSDTQVKAIADSIDKDLGKNGIKCYHKEGYQSLNWVLMDYFDIVVHVFKTESRNFYNLEKLWADAPCKIYDDSLDNENRKNV